MATGILLHECLKWDTHMWIQAMSFGMNQLPGICGRIRISVAIIRQLCLTKIYYLKAANFCKEFSKHFRSLAINRDVMLITSEFIIQLDHQIPNKLITFPDHLNSTTICKTPVKTTLSLEAYLRLSFYLNILYLHDCSPLFQ